MTAVENDFADEAGLSAPHTAAGKLQRALLERLRVHERDGMLPTSNRFLFYELMQLGVVSKEPREKKPGCTTVRRPDQDTLDALTHLREEGVVPWDWIEDETRSLDEWETAARVAEYVADAVQYAFPGPLGSDRDSHRISGAGWESLDGDREAIRRPCEVHAPGEGRGQQQGRSPREEQRRARKKRGR